MMQPTNNPNRDDHETENEASQFVEESARNPQASKLLHPSTTFRRSGLLVLLVLFSSLALLYDVTVPLFEKPDELKHFAMIQYIQTEWRLPVVRSGVTTPWDQEGTQPPLYHIIAAVATSWLDLGSFTEPDRNPHYVDDRSFVWRQRGNNNLYLHTPSENTRLNPIFIAARISRWLSIVAGIITLTLTYYLASNIFSTAPRNNLASTSYRVVTSSILAAALIAFIPQYLHTSSAITNDSLAVTLAAAGLLGMVLVINNGSSLPYNIFIGAVLGLGAITKLSLLYLAPLVALVYFFDLSRHRSFGRFIKDALILGGLLVLLAGWWYWRNWQLYGDPTALNAHLLYRGGPLDPRPSLAQLWQSEIVGLELSFWAAFGAGQILFDPWLYTLLGILKFVVLIGFFMGVWSLIRSLIHQEKLTFSALSGFVKGSGHSGLKHLLSILLLSLWMLLIFAALLRWMQITPASWGRLLFPTLPALGILTVWSLIQFTQKIHYPTQPIIRATAYIPFLPALLTALLFLLAIISPFRYIQAAYAKPTLINHSDVQTDLIEPLNYTYDGVLRLIGYTIDQPTIHPGEWLPLTLYWQALQPLTTNYSAFAHLLTPDGRALAQSNSYPAGGNWPTSMLEPGQVLQDKVFIFVPPDAEVPTATRVALGLFEFDEPQRPAKPVVDANQQPVESIVAGPPLIPHQWPELTPQEPLAANFANQISLIGIDPIHENQIIKPGNAISMTLYWATNQPPGQDLNLYIHLIDTATGQQTAGFDAPPDFPTGLWVPGTKIRDTRILNLPSELPSGTYDIRIGWYNLADFARLPLSDGGDGLNIDRIVVE